MSNNDNIPQTIEAIAYQLMKDILASEHKIYKSDSLITHESKVTKRDILDTYKECLELFKDSTN
jgi:hypothetical protein